MSGVLVQSSIHRGQVKQPMHNEFIQAPTIIWVREGSQKVLFRDSILKFNVSNWIMVSTPIYISYLNGEENNKFLSQSLTFYMPPPRDWLSDNSEQKRKFSVEVTPSLSYFFDLVSDMSGRGLDSDTQKHVLLGFYSELRKAGYLDSLFLGKAVTLRERLTQYFSTDPGYDYKIEVVAERFAMSKATLIRHLASEDTSYREILADVRMTYALHLLQKSNSQIETALACGYKSPTRFANRFKQKYGITPYEYKKHM